MNSDPLRQFAKVCQGVSRQFAIPWETDDGVVHAILSLVCVTILEEYLNNANHFLYRLRRARAELRLYHIQSFFIGEILLRILLRDRKWILFFFARFFFDLILPC